MKILDKRIFTYTVAYVHIKGFAAGKDIKIQLRSTFDFVKNGLTESTVTEELLA